MPDELGALDATAQAELVRCGELTALELVDAAIARLERLNPQLNAVILPALEQARARAASGDLPDGAVSRRAVSDEGSRRRRGRAAATAPACAVLKRRRAGSSRTNSYI